LPPRCVAPAASTLRPGRIGRMRIRSAAVGSIFQPRQKCADF